MIDAVTTCWSCAVELPRGASTCPACSHPQDEAPPVRQRFGRPGGPPSVVYLLLIPIVCAWACEQRGYGWKVGVLLGALSWMCSYANARGWIMEKTS